MFKKKQLASRRSPGERVSANQPKVAPSVFSYRASRSAASDNLGRTKKRGSSMPADATNPQSKQSRVSPIKRGLRVVLFLIMAALLINSLILSKEATIVIASANGKPQSASRDPKAYENAVRDILASSFRNTNKVTVDTRAISETLRENFPELAGATVSLPLVGHRLTVYVDVSSSRLLITAADGSTYVLDDHGKAIAPMVTTDELLRAGLPQLHDQSHLDIEVGKTVLPSTTVAFIAEVSRQFKEAGIEVASMTLPTTPGEELQVRIKDVPYYIKFNVRGNARVEVGTFLALKQYLDAQKKTPTAYIDVRVENRAYYR